MKIMENAFMVHLKFTRDAVYEDEKEMDIAVEYPPIWDDEYDEWREDLYRTVQNTYNKYRYWSNIQITYAVYEKHSTWYKEIIVEV